MQYNTTLFLKRNSSNILTLVSITGVVSTGILSGKAAVKVHKILEKKKCLNKLDKLKETWKCYIPPILMGAGTISCIFSNNLLNLNNQASITSAYAFLDQSYKNYKNKVKEICGEETHNQIIDEISKESCTPPYISSSDGFISSTLDFDCKNEVLRTFYDAYSNRYFDSSIDKVIQAEYHLNRNFCLGGCISINEFYDFLGISNIDFGDDIGWNMYNGEIYWIDFNHRIRDDGVCVVEFIFDPWINYLEED